MPFEPAPSNGEGVVWRYFISQLLGLPQVSLRLRHFLKPEAGFPGSENELGMGATLREAKGIVGALCKSRTPPPNRRIVPGPRAKGAREALGISC